MDAPECTESARFLLVSVPTSRWRIGFRGAVTLLYVVAGLIAREAFAGDPTRRGQGVVLLLVAAIALSVATFVLLETILKR